MTIGTATGANDPASGSSTASTASRVPPRTGPILAGWMIAFALTRLLPLMLTFAPSLYGPNVSDPTGDLRLYGGWGEQIALDGAVPYRDIDIEYPPGSLPFVVVPTLLGHGRFSASSFVTLLFALDAVAMATLVLLARRATSYRGAAAWLLLPPILGVLLYGRLDVVPAVATLLALERAYARRWFASGVWFGLGAAAKLFPALLLPLAVLAAAGQRWRLAIGATVGAVAAWLPYAVHTGDVVHDVLGYHGARGIHLESLWGSLLNLQRIGDGAADLVFEYGAFHITGPGAPPMLRLTTVLSVVTVVLTAAVAAVRWWRHPHRARTELPLAATATLALLLGTGRVFSPQFTIWLLAAAAVLYAVRPRVAAWTAPLLVAIVVLTALGYPLGFDLLRAGARWPALVLLWRNLATVVFGLVLLVWWALDDRHAVAAGLESGSRGEAQGAGTRMTVGVADERRS